MHQYLMRRNGITVAVVIAGSAEDALAVYGHPMAALEDVENIIAFNGLNYSRYGTTYAFSTTGIAVVQED